MNLFVNLRRHTDTSQTIWVVDDDNTSGQLQAVVNGVTYAGETMSSANDYTAVVDITGLQPATEYEYSLLVDGVPAGISGKFRTAPKYGDDLKLIFTGDALNISGAWGNLITRENDADAFFCYEYKYIDGSEYTAAPCNAVNPGTLNNPYGATGNDPENNPDFVAALSTYRIKHRCSITQESARYLWSTMVPHYLVWNNHEFYSSTPVPGPGMNHFDGAFQACYEYYFKGNPVNNDANLDSVPSPVAYFRHTLGSVEIICDDVTSYSEGALDTALSGTTYNPQRGEGRQLSWIKSSIDNCKADFLIIFHQSAVPGAGKPIAQPEWDDANDGILKHIDDRDDLTVIILTTNNHLPFARMIKLNANKTDGVFEMGVNPLTQVNPSTKDTLAGDVLYFSDNTPTLLEDGYKSPADANWVYSTVEIIDGKLVVKLKNALTSKVRFHAEFEKGNREPKIIYAEPLSDAVTLQAFV